MGQTLSNCIPQYPSQLQEEQAEEADEVDGEEWSDGGVVPERSGQALHKSDSTESRGLALHNNPPENASHSEQLKESAHTSSEVNVQQPTKRPTQTSSTPSPVPTSTPAPTKPNIDDQDFFTDMKPKYAPPPIVNPKLVSRLTMDDAAISHSGWDDDASSDKGKPKDNKKNKLDSTATSESFDDFDD